MCNYFIEFSSFYFLYKFLDELNQTTTLSKPRNSKSIKVNVDVQEIGDMKLHISNLLRGRTRMGTYEFLITYLLKIIH